MMRSYGSRGAFTLIELLVVVAIIAVLIGILIPSLSVAKEMANRSSCGSNLAMIGKGCLLYAAAQGDAYPTVPPNGTLGGMGTGYWSWPPWPASGGLTYDASVADDYSQIASPVAGDTPACLWLLNLQQYTTPKLYNCRSDPALPVPALMDYVPADGGPGTLDDFGYVAGNGNAPNTLSYSFSYPWYADNMPPGPWWRNSMDAAIPIGSDMAPSGQSATDDPTISPGQAISNSKNHSGGAGQNVLYADGHVTFSSTNRVAQNGGNIFCLGLTLNYVTADSGGVQGFSNPSLTRSLDPPYDVIMVPAIP